MKDQTTKPNVLLICVDQWAGELMRPSGHPTVMTPTLAQLARSGVNFTRAYSACPTCIPARRTLMTGQTAQTHGDRIFNQTLEMPEGVPTLPQCFRAAGYQAFAVGKLHVYPQRNRIGFDDVILNEEGRHHLGHGADDYELFLAEQGYAGQEFAGGMCNNDYMMRPWHLPEYCHQTNWTAREMSKVIRRRDPRKPSFWYMSFNCPHPPVRPLAEYLDMYHDVDVDMPRFGTWSETQEALPYALRRAPTRFAMHGALDEEIRHAKRGWYANLTHIDHQIRVVIGTLREQGLLDNTIIGFVSDHGDMLGDHHQWAKGVMYEASARIPFIFLPPQGDTRLGLNVTDDRLVELRDVMPTLLELAGLPIPETVEGVSLLSDERRPHLYGEHYENDQATRMIRDEQYKLIYYPIGNHTQLFDIDADPHEQHDLASSPDHVETREHLTALLMEELYGTDRQWVQDGRLVGFPDKPLSAADERGLAGQRGLRFL